MGYPIPSNSPSVLVNGQQHAAAAFEWANPIGNYFIAGVFRYDGDQGWTLVSRLLVNTAPEQLLVDIQTKGGGVNYMNWLVAEFNKLFRELFAPPAPPSGEPTTGAEAVTYVTGHLAQYKLTLVQNVPVLG